MHKRIITLISCLSISAFLFGCGSTKTNETDTTTSSKTEAEDKNELKEEKDTKEENENSTENKDLNSTSGGSNSSTSENENTSVANPTPSVPLDWNGIFNLKNGTGKLRLVQIDAHSFGYEISGTTSADNKSVPSTSGTAQYDGSTADALLSDGSTLKFIYENNAITVVQLKNNETVFQGVYLPN